MDAHESHHIYVYEVETGQLVWKEQGDSNKIFDCSFSAAPASYLFVTVGAKHIKFWDPIKKTSEMGIFSSISNITSFACVTFADNGVCYTGGANG